MTAGTGDAVGRRVAGRYRLVEQLGAGAYGTVWRAFDETLDVTVAAKEVRLSPAASLDDTARMLARVEREARMVAKLRDHPHVVTVLDVVREGGLPWIIMEFIPSVSLAEAIHVRGAFPPGEVARIGVAVLDALTAAHQAGITHRDVKPANILIGEDGRVVLVDFGVAVHASEPTITEGPIGTLAYMAPEQFGGTRMLSASDLFSLGATLYCTVEGVSAFSRPTEAATIQAVLTEHPRLVRAPEPLAGAILGFLVKDPERRLTGDAGLAALRVAATELRELPQESDAASASDAFMTLGDGVRAHVGRVEADATRIVVHGQPAPELAAEADPVEMTGPIRYREAALRRAVGGVLSVCALAAAAVPWILEPVIDLPAWTYALAVLWSGFFGCWAGVFVYLLGRPDVLVLDETSLRYRRGAEDHVLPREQVSGVRVRAGRIEIDLSDPTGAGPYQGRSEPPHLDDAGVLVFCVLEDLSGASDDKVVAALRRFGGAAFTEVPRPRHPPAGPT
ncbi:serine/threonine-protein kinase [Frankia sp. QA3]|uniref:serine/threonine-protein kinase n=1 Tax=Frankia sp. QA3 TaxID=710111 RepID=UPI000269CEF3|nr:serine/threonine-protein kinase [Frankia sp. QA3]EIV96277.1 protein kinase family protein [Frankia sp. QA3]